MNNLTVIQPPHSQTPSPLWEGAVTFGTENTTAAMTQLSPVLEPPHSDKDNDNDGNNDDNDNDNDNNNDNDDDDSEDEMRRRVWGAGDSSSS